MLKITGGEFQGRALNTPKGAATRPTLERVRETVFNMWQSQIEGACFLDLYAGSGAMGLEALSRAAKQVTFVENSVPAIKCIEKNCAALGVIDCSQVMRLNVKAAIGKLGKQGKRFDLIYIDPPYSDIKSEKIDQLHLEILSRIDANSLLADHGQLIIEDMHRKQGASIISQEFRTLSYKKTKTAGSVSLYCFVTPEPMR